MGALIAAQATSTLVGREDQLAALREAQARAAAGQLFIVLIEGEPGSGKTRLAADFLDSERGHATRLIGRGHPFGATTSFGLWMEVLDSYLAQLRISEVAAPKALSPHRRLMHAIGSVLSELSRSRMLIIVLDDIHLADGSSWEALDYLATPLMNCPILIIACAREGQLPARGNSVFVAIEQQGRLDRLTLRPFGREETRALARSLINRDPPATLVDWLLEHSLGNPLFITLLLQDLISRNANLTIPRSVHPPDAVQQYIRARLASLSTQSRATLDVLAVSKKQISLQLLLDVTRRRPTALIADLEKLVEAHLVSEHVRNGEPTYQVAHALIGEAIYHGMLLSRRRDIHRSFARTLLAQGELMEAAAHFAHSASIGEAEAINTLIHALQKSEAQQSPFAAMTVLEWLLKLLPSGDSRWIRVLDAMNWGGEWLLDYTSHVSADVGLRVMLQVELALGDSSDALRRSMVQLRIAGFSVWDVSAAETTAAACRQALAAFENVREWRLALIARLWLAWVAGISGDLPAMVRGMELVIDHAAALGAKGLNRHAHEAVSWALVRQGRFVEAEHALDQAIDLANETGSKSQLVSDLLGLAYLRAVSGQLKTANEVVNRARAISPGVQDVILMAGIDLLAGDARSAFDTIRQAASASSTQANSRLAWVLIYAIIAAARVGQFEEAHAWLTAAAPYQGRVGMGWDFFRAWAEGCLHRNEGRFEAAAAALGEAAAGLQRSGYLPAAAIVLADLTDLLAETSDVHGLRMASAQLDALAKQIDSEPYGALARLASAQLSLVLGVRTPARRRALNRTADQIAGEVAETLHSLGYRGWEARAQQLRGRALIATDRPLAAELFERSVLIAESCGLRRLRDDALLHLQGLGRPGRRTYQALTGGMSLSRREGQIVRLAIQGITARDIGKRLEISKRTVETHLANAYTKLGIRSRIELIRKAKEFSA